MKEIYYSIGKACKICSVTARTLRYYEEIGLVTPDKIDQDTGYRFYLIDTLRYVQTIRYLVDQGFSLDEVRGALLNDDIHGLRDLFLKQMDETEKSIEFYHQRLDSLKDWCSILLEGDHVLRHPEFRAYTRYYPEDIYFFYEKDRDPEEEEDSESYIETEYYTTTKQNGHSMVDMGGAFNLVYDSYSDRMDGTYDHLMLLQIIYKNARSVQGTRPFGGFNAVAGYHIGPRENIRETYEKLLGWAEYHRFSLRGNSIERHVIDVYSTRDPQKYVTEILLPIDEPSDGLKLLYDWTGRQIN